MAQAFVNPPKARRFHVPTIRFAPLRLGGITESSASSRLASLDRTSGGGSSMSIVDVVMILPSATVSVTSDHYPLLVEFAIPTAHAPEG